MPGEALFRSEYLGVPFDVNAAKALRSAVRELRRAGASRLDAAQILGSPVAEVSRILDRDDPGPESPPG
jgi:hypothetical protein